MLLAIDVGNSNTVLGVYPAAAQDVSGNICFGPELRACWRITTPEARTADELGVTCRSFFASAGLRLDEITGIGISSVVPPVESTLRLVCERFFGVKPLFIEPGVRTGMPLKTDNPSEAGADRICNCVAAFDRFKAATIVVDMGTATTFDVVSARGEFLGGAIAPGLGISAEALFTHAARLPRIKIAKPAKVIGTGTVDNMEIGLYYGYIGLVDGILERMLAELGGEGGEPGELHTIGTGGLAPLIADGSRYLKEVDEHLTLTGLRLLFERNVVRPEGGRLRRRG